MKTKAEELAAAEDEIAVKIGKRNGLWAEAYILIKKTETERLWEAGGYTSFGAWVKSFAKRKEISETSVWKTKMAGDFLAISQPGFPKNKPAVSMETALFVERLSFGDRPLAERLYRQAADGHVTQAQARAAWRRTRHAAEAAGCRATVGRNGKRDFTGPPSGVDPCYELKRASSGKENDIDLSDQEIASIVHRYLGARVDRGTLVSLLRPYSESL